MSHLTRRAQAVVLVTAAVAGYAGAAVYSALAAPGLPAVPVADDYGPGDGLTRYVVTAAAGDATPLLGALEAIPGVANAQRLSDGSALVATDGLAPEALRGVGGVADVALSPSVPVFGTVSDPYWSTYGWNLENTGSNAYQQSAVADADDDATTGWETNTGAGVIVAVVDTGYDSDHEDLAGALWTNPAEACGSGDTDGNGKAGDCHGWNFTTNSADVDNGSGGEHGASVAGAVGARAGNGLGTAGVAPGVTIMPLVIGSGSNVDVMLGAEAIRYAADHGAAVVNASWGGTVTGTPLTILRSAVAYAASKGTLVVAAAGNDALDRDTSPLYPASLTEDSVITVGATTAADTISDFSAYGATSVDVFAPGTLVFSTTNTGGYALSSGTSIASPQVAGALALYRAAMPGATIQQVRQALLDDAQRIPALAGKSVTGARLTLDKVAAAGTSGAVRYDFASLNTASAGAVSPRVSVTGTAAAGAYSVAVGLGMVQDGEIWAVADEPITLGGATLTTNDSGEALFTLGSRTGLEGLVLSPGLDLGEGRYVLTVQLYRNGDPLGRTTAAPVLVGQAAAQPPTGATDPGTTNPGTTTPGTTDPGTTNPGTTTPGTTNPGTTTPGTTTPGTTTPGTTTPGTTTPGTTNPGTTTPGTTNPGTTTPGTTQPGTTNPGTTTPGTTQPGTTNPGTTAPGTTDPGTTNPGTTTPGTTTPGTTQPGTTDPGTTDPGTQPGDGGVITYPGVGVFQVTSISPTRVTEAGGTTVTVTGRALPANIRVRIGTSAQATVVSSSSTQAVFRTPARVAGAYDVHLFAVDGTTQVLAGALEYVGADAGTTPEPGAGGTTPTPGTDGTTPQPGTGDTTPTPGTGGGSTPGTDPGTGGSTPGAGSTGPTTATGPHGERLVRSTRFAGLGASFWAMDCSSSCTGTVI